MLLCQHIPPDPCFGNLICQAVISLKAEGGPLILPTGNHQGSLALPSLHVDFPSVSSLKDTDGLA